MHESDLRRLLDDVAAGRLDPDAAVTRLRRLPFADIGVARVDHHRSLRQGLPEAVYGPGKSPEVCVSVVGELLAADASPVLLTRADPAQVEAVLAAHPGGVVHGDLVVWNPAPPVGHRVVVVTAGSADAPVADECAAVLAAAGVGADRLGDVGVAGLHRLLADLDRVTAAEAVVVVAGMEGALASVVGGLTDGPVVAVPTSVGYGSGLDGVTALMAMTASCAAGVTVVGIDNGYGAACAVLRALRSRVRA